MLSIANRRLLTAWLLAVVFVLLAPFLPASAEPIPVPRLQAIYPMGGAAGAKVELVLAGEVLEGASQLLFSHPSIKATPAMSTPDAFYPEARPIEKRFVVSIGSDVPAGLYEARLVNRLGASNARYFAVGDARTPESLEKEPNDGATTANEVAINSVVNGLSEDRGGDFYAFAGKKGMRLILHVAGRRLDSRADPVIAIYDAAGVMLARAHDALRQESVIDFTAPADGRYVVSVHDFLYDGGEQYPYRLSIGTGPWIDFIDPPIATPGTAAKHTIYGRNLPGGTPAPGMTADGKPNGPPLEKLDVVIPISAAAGDSVAVETWLSPEDAALPTIAYRLPWSGGVSNPARLALISGPVTSEQEPNNTIPTAQLLTLPATILGQFNPAADRDWFAFEGKKGQGYWIEAVSARLGLPTDPALIVQYQKKNDDGKLAVDKAGEPIFTDLVDVDDQVRNQNDDMRLRAANTDDAAASFVAPEDATYRVCMRDLYSGLQGNPRFKYLLSIQTSRAAVTKQVRERGQPTVEPAPPDAIQGDFQLIARAPAADPEQNNSVGAAILLRKGGAVPIDVVAIRRNGFDLPIHLTAEGLPPGVTAEPAVIAPSGSVASLVLRASADAVTVAIPIRVVGQVKAAAVGVVRTAAPAEQMRAQNGENLPTARIVSQLMLAVLDDLKPPFGVQAGEGKVWRMARGGKLQVPVRVIRSPEFKGAVQLEAKGMIESVRTAGSLAFDPAVAEKMVELDVDGNAPLGTFSFILRDAPSISYQRSPEVAAQAAEDKTRIQAVYQDRTQASQKSSQTRQQEEANARQSVEMFQRAEQIRQQNEQARTQAKSAMKETDAQMKQLKQAYDTAAEGTKKAADALTVANAGADAGAKQAATAAAAQAQQAVAQTKTQLDAASARATEAGTKFQAADEALVKAAAAKIDADAKMKAADIIRQTAVDAEKKAQEDLRAAEQIRQSAEQRAQRTAQFAQAQDRKFLVPSTPVIVEIVAAPFAVTLNPATLSVKAGGEPVEVMAAVSRELGFDDDLQFDLQPPAGFRGSVQFTEKSNIVAKGLTQGKVAVQADAGATPGDHAFTLRLRYKFNGGDLTYLQPLGITVAPPDKVEKK